MCAKVSHIADVFGPACCRHMRAEVPRELNGETADGARSTMHEDAHTGLQIRRLYQTDPRTNAGVDHRRSLIEGEVVRQRRKTLTVAYDGLRIGSGLDVRGDNADPRAD